MAPSNNTSFIPKSPRLGATRGRVTKRIYILSYVSYVVFFSVLIAVVAVYVYASVLNNKLDSDKTALAQEQQRFSQDQLDEVRDLEKQLLVASDLLDRSTAVSQLFTELEGVVSDKVLFTGASYTREDGGQFTFELRGYANNFNDVIYQRDMFNRSQVLASSQLDTYDYSIGGEGGVENLAGSEPTVKFTFTDMLPVSAIAYTAPATVITDNGSDTTIDITPPTSDSMSTTSTTTEPFNQTDATATSTVNDTNQGV